ncbi:hypothetical protein K503DRAFT_783152 [Rhizopogon vinicolor AM-OR11-026]|uniref:Uncharacterized protein n=1 Tax=Rhizopogon vinicolor AM-OR11-026 TaxID=1314800 RepID=A0A1B7MZS5_9AGAM|nr:hypothetical protein K503DRAFT_783152 [Rhizopogon vinicolor AM-OR11-026]
MRTRYSRQKPRVVQQIPRSGTILRIKVQEPMHEGCDAFNLLIRKRKSEDALLGSTCTDSGQSVSYHTEVCDVPQRTANTFHSLPPHPTHTSRPDGLLQVNPDARHPILDLSARAEEEWNINLPHASRILPNVIHEYYRRWAYATKHKAIQYDWAFAHARKVHQFQAILYCKCLTMRIREVKDDLPLFVVVFGPHGNPNVFLTEEMRSRAVEAGKSGDYIDIDKNRTPYTIGLATCLPSAEPYPGPQFSVCSTKLHADIRVPQPGSWISDVESDSDEEGKWEGKFWRAMNTGMHHAEHMLWRVARRNRLMEMAQRPNGSVEVLLSDVECEGGDDGKRSEPETCKELEELFDWRRTMSVRRRAQVQVYGNGWSSQFKWLMTANTLTSKSTIYPEWFTDGLAPRVYYIPI